MPDPDDIDEDRYVEKLQAKPDRYTPAFLKGRVSDERGITPSVYSGEKEASGMYDELSDFEKKFYRSEDESYH